MERKTVRVEGLPIDIPLERLKDKLTIHFLRSRHGGGDIENIDVVLETPAYALVMFEEADVAQRVLKVKGHVLSVNGRTYALKVTPLSTELSPDEIFSRVSMIVDYRRFPDSIKHAMKSLREIHKDVQFSFDQTEELFTVNGKYTKIQAFSNDVMKMLGLRNKNLNKQLSQQRNLEKDDGSKIRVTQNSDEVIFPLVESKSEMWNAKPKVENETQSLRSKAEKQNPRSKPEMQNERVVEGNGLKAEYGNRKDAQAIERLEDFSLVMDSDIYMYIQKFHWAEYQKILCKHEVEAVDVSSDDITTLYLQAGFETSNHVGALTNALYDLLHLYQQFEASLRKEQISKTDLKYDHRTLQKVPKELQKLCPSLLCLEDDRYFHIIGSVIDVSQAKHYIQDLVPPKDMGKLVKPAEPSLGPNAVSRHKTASPRSSVEYKTDILPKKTSPTKFEMKGEHKLAANFIHPKAEVSLLKPTSLVDNDGLGSSDIYSREGDHQKNGEKLLSIQLNQEHPMRNTETLPESGTGAGESMQKDPQVTSRMKGDISPKTLETSPSCNMDRGTDDFYRTGTRTSLGSMKASLHGNALQYLGLYGIAGMSSLSDSEPSKPQITLRRSNSFSAVRLKEVNSPSLEINFKEPNKEVKDTKILDEMCLYTWLWAYMKDMSNITDLCTENAVRTDEENMQDITILKIRADDKTKLDVVKQNIQSLYYRLSTELTYQTFSYCEIGVEGPHDEALSEWCCSLLSHCDKLRLSKLEHSLHLTYPKEAQSSIAEYTKFIQSKSKALRHSLQPCVTDKHMPKQHQTEEDKHQGHAWDVKHNYASDPHSAIANLVFRSDVSDHQICLDREEAIGEMNSGLQRRTSDDLSAFQGMEGEEDSSQPKELLALSSDDIKDMAAENGICIGQTKAFQEGSISEREALTHPRDLMRLEIGGMETDASKVKKALPNKFQLMKNKCKGDLHDETGNQRHSLHPWDDIPLSLPLKLYNTQQNYMGLKALNEQSGFISKLSLGGPANLDKYIFPNRENQEESATKPQLRQPSMGQEALAEKARNCDQCKKGDTGTATAQCGHSFCRSCFSASEDTCAACLRSHPADIQYAVKGKMTHRTLSSSLMGYYQDPTLKIIYDIPDGIQGPGDPNPGSRYAGGRFEAFLPDNKEGRKLLTLLERALDQGLTFKIQPHPSGDKLTWNILHKTVQQGGRLKNGYPDAQYLRNVFQQLKGYSIE